MVGGTRSYEMARRMVQAGHEVHMISSWREKSSKNGWRHEIIEGINLHWLSVHYDNKFSFLGRIFAFLKFALHAGPKAKSIGGDVVLATSTPLTIALPGVYAAKRMGIPMVFEVRDLWPELPIAIGTLSNPILISMARWLEKFAYKNSARVVALSPGMAEGIRSQGYPDELISIIPNSCDNDIFAPSTEGALRFRSEHPEIGDGPIILYAGTFGQINGVEFLPKLAARLKNSHPDLRFVAIGRGAEFASVREQASSLGVLNANYFQYDSKPKLKLVEAFQAATISMSLFIDLPEMQHNSANKFFDTLASGTAVAINYYGWQANLIENNYIGVVLGPDIDLAADKLSKVIDHPAEVEKMGMNARIVAENDFDRNKLASDLIWTLEVAVAESN